MRLGILGGTFDPPHVGHLLAASDAVDQLGLDRLIFIPNAAQPLKGAGEASPQQRLEMVRLLVGEDPRFAVDPIEIERDGVSYTVDTLSAYAAAHPGAERFLLIGADVVPTLGQWRNAARIMELAQIAVLRRNDGSAADVGIGASLRWLDTRCVAVSSREVRARVRAGLAIRGFVPEAVAGYVEAVGLYRD